MKTVQCLLWGVAPVVVLSQVLRSSGKGNKTEGMMTLLPVKAAEVKSEQGKMRFVPLEAGTWPALLEQLRDSSA
ncbi:MAG: hypothetical protein IIC50_06710 [Planctomycetes bacterium]|nr:hypothetical protein [Planctomycetota bacterium]